MMEIRSSLPGGAPLADGRRRRPRPLPLLLTLLPLLLPAASGIDCFRCSSVNGSDPRCQDPFHNNYTDLLVSGCMGGRKQRNGLFPASACVKLSGFYSDDGTSMIIRDCAVDSATLTIDTELTRMSHCGSFEFQDRYVHGCISACDSFDGCNTAVMRRGGWLLAPALALTLAANTGVVQHVLLALTLAAAPPSPPDR
ncbi:uncharacterized protein LOC122373891 [Amphibalanus amphitrite]|nr:uncharacterized protein LOC122373891 [Amphibalanus amphitrite]